MDFRKILKLIYQLAYFVYLSLVASVKSFLGLLGLITCDNNYLCYTALTALMACVMLHNKKLPKSLWGEAVNTACHTLNRVYFKPNSKKTLYELWRGKKPAVKYFRIFGSDCYILRDRENLEKFDVKSDKGYFLRYSSTSRAYRVYNLRTKIVMESSNVVINDEVCSEVQSENIALV